MAKQVFSFTVTGDREMIAKIRTHAKLFPRRVERALFRSAEAIIRRSKEEFVPERHSILENSGFVEPPIRRGSHTSVRFGFGGAASAYAIAVHEHLSQFSPPSWQATEQEGDPVVFQPTGRGPKYLERPVLEAMETLARDLAEDLHL